MSTQDARAQFVEELADVLSTVGGIPPTGGRIFAALLSSDQPYVSGPQLRSLLNISSGSLSSMSALLEARDMIVRTTRPHTRGDLFSVKPDHWLPELARAARGVATYATLARSFAASTDSAAAREQALEFADFYSFFSSRIAAIGEEWQLERSSITKRTRGGVGAKGDPRPVSPGHLGRVAARVAPSPPTSRGRRGR